MSRRAEPEDRETDRWFGITALAFAAAAVGMITRSPAALLVVALGVGYAAYARAAQPPNVDLAVERTVSETAPDPGETVAVELTVENVGDRTLPDVRLADGVPDALDVVDGTPRHATALRPGETATVEYEVEAGRGGHDFTPVVVVARDWLGVHEREHRVAAETRIECVPRLPEPVSLPLRSQTGQQVGTVTTDTAGSGVEFHTVREYRSGDPLTRVDWRRQARTGELATVEFREERAATVVFIVDTRAEAYITDRNGVSAVDHAVRAVGALARDLMSDGNQVGVASYGPQWSWLAPGLGRDHAVRLRNQLALGDGFSPTPDETEFLFGLTLRRVEKHLPANAQVVFCSPVADEVAVTAARRLEAYGHAVTLLSPDVIDGAEAGAQVARLEREERLRAIRRTHGRVIDWDVHDPLAVAVADARRRWSR